MKALPWLNPGAVFVEIKPASLAVLHAENVREWPLERSPTGALTESCVARIKAELPAALGRKPWHPRLEARCALPAAGVSLRRWQFPQSADDELQRVIHLQIEGGFPLSPDDLAWGWLRLGEARGMQDVLVAAVKRQTVAEYTVLLSACGLHPSFTLGVLARGGLPSALSIDGALLDFGREHSEWLSADGAGALRLRALPWGEQTIVSELVVQTGLGREAAESLVAKLGDPTSDGADSQVQRAVEAAVDALLPWLPAGKLARLEMTGRLAAIPAFTTALATRLGPAVTCESLEPIPAARMSATLRGLQRQAHSGTPGTTLLLRTETAQASAVLARPAPRKWAIVAGCLLLGWLALPYLEAVLLQPRLAARVAAVKARQEDLNLIDREAGFLRYLRQNQAPYLETLYVLGKTAPPGTRIDSFTLNRKGELSLRLSMRQPQEVTDFRSKLADSGLFSSVVVEEQTPTPDRQKVLVRMSASVKPPNAREGLKILAADLPTSSPAGGPTGGPSAAPVTGPGTPKPAQP